MSQDIMDITSNSVPGRNLPAKAGISSWTTSGVVQYFLSADCAKYAGFFQKLEIDGKALLLLNRETLLHWILWTLVELLTFCIWQMCWDRIVSKLSLLQTAGSNYYYQSHFHSLTTFGLDYQNFVALKRDTVEEWLKRRETFYYFFSGPKDRGCQMQGYHTISRQKKKFEHSRSRGCPGFNVIMYISRVRSMYST